MTVQPIDKELYAIVKKEASELFTSPTSVYRSAWIVRTYKLRGGRYEKSISNDKPTGLKRWFDEKWVDINRPGKPCGRPKTNVQNGLYPLCRPTIKVTDKTPRLLEDIPLHQIIDANTKKQRMKKADWKQ
jgi:antibiotic biosynthesis monooxygenase (ABM) superfamily enzyme